MVGIYAPGTTVNPRGGIMLTFRKKYAKLRSPYPQGG